MIAAAHPSLADLGDLSPGLARIFAPYAGTAMLAASALELARLRRHIVESCCVQPADLALFDHFPSDERRAIARELHELVHRGMQRLQEEHARRLAAQESVEALRRRLLTDAQRRRLVELGIWAHALLGDQELAERLVDRYFDLTTPERVQGFAARQDELIAAFRAAVLTAYASRPRRRRSSLPEPASDPGITAAYASLGLSTAASRQETCRVYRALAKQHHPDLGGDETRMRELNRAYAVIAGAWRT